jgi:Restriction endonuclease
MDEPRDKTPGKVQLEKSTLYEKALQAILQFARDNKILEYAKVEGSNYYPGLLSEATLGRQIDVTIHLIDEKRILVECKQRTSKVNLNAVKLDVEDVEAFDAKCRLDIGQDVTIPIMMVTTVGFTQAAKNYAKKRNVSLATLNYAATPEKYKLEMEGNTLVGFLEQLKITSEASLQETPAQPEAHDGGEVQLL